ncbi:MAG: metal-sensing transcriptional repressor [Selenomonadaceae bacterium]|nr:metal-sensing transcriptional repressor [Selenomonadaceae bacterium]
MKMDEPGARHEHVLEDGTVLSHSHVHSHEQTEQVLRRMKYVIGHMNGIYKMVEEGRDCSDVLIQISAVTAALQKLKTIILQDHIEHCIVDAVQHNDHEAIERLNHAIAKLME